MTEADEPGTTPAPRAPRAAKGRKGTVAPASRVLTAGLSIAAACAIVTALAVSQPVDSGGEVELDVSSGVDAVPVPTTAVAPPPTTIVVNRIYVPVPVGGGGLPGPATSGRSTDATSSGAQPPAGAAPSTPAAAAPTPTAAPAPAPAATSRAS